jgi:hypothetical protein
MVFTAMGASTGLQDPWLEQKWSLVSGKLLSAAAASVLYMMCWKSPMPSHARIL